MDAVLSPLHTDNPPLTFTWFERNNAAIGQRGQMAWDDLCRWIATNAPCARTKDGLPLIKLATFRGDHRSNETAEAVYGIEGDYDAGVMQPDVAADLLEQAGIAAFIHTSPSHRAEKPRWRVLCPLSRATPPAQRQGLVSGINGVLRGVLAKESWTLSQPYYVGSVEGGESVQCWNIAGRYLDTVEVLVPSDQADRGEGLRKPLGTERGPSLKGVTTALYSIDPNELDHHQWRNVTAGFRQSATGYADDAMVRLIWEGWCTQFTKNDASDNAKLWGSFDAGTQLGWGFLRDFALKHGDLSDVDRAQMLGLGGGIECTGISPAIASSVPQLGDILTDQEQRIWFAGCTLIGPENRIIDAKGQYFDVGAFNSTFGGKRFIIDREGRTTDEAWKAATRSTLWTVPKVDGTSFRPDLPTGTIATDELGRRSINIYITATIERMEGDPAPFLKHLAALIPNADDQQILLAYMAHNAQYPGFKIPWAPVIQSTEGAGKNIIKYAMTHVIGDHYSYPPNPKELAAGGGKFNDWMHRKLFLIADEIKTDDKRDLVEILKPMISETTLEMQGKGRDQRKADNPANWMFFTNWKDAIPVHANGRRFAIFYSAIQSLQDALDRGMNDAYFKSLYDEWLGAKTHKTGLKIIADYLLSYPIECGAIPMRAPHTSSMAEAIVESRGWLESIIAEAVEDQRNGFRAGWISTAAVAKLLRDQGRDAKSRTVGDALKALGYHRIGQAGRGYFQDDPANPNRRPWLHNIDPQAVIANYARTQNYE